MKKSQFTEEQIAYALHEVEVGTPVAEICRQIGVSEQTFYRWKKKFAGMGIAELRRLKQLEEENRKLKQLVADLSLDKHMLQEALRKTGEAGPEARGGGLLPGRRPGQRAASVPGGRGAARELPLPEPGQGPDGAAAAAARPRRGARPLRLPA